VLCVPRAAAVPSPRRLHVIVAQKRFDCSHIHPVHFPAYIRPADNGFEFMLHAVVCCSVFLTATAKVRRRCWLALAGIAWCACRGLAILRIRDATPCRRDTCTQIDGLLARRACLRLSTCPAARLPEPTHPSRAAPTLQTTGCDALLRRRLPDVGAVHPADVCPVSLRCTCCCCLHLKLCPCAGAAALLRRQ